MSSDMSDSNMFDSNMSDSNMSDSKCDSTGSSLFHGLFNRQRAATSTGKDPLTASMPAGLTSRVASRLKIKAEAPMPVTTAPCARGEGARGEGA